MVNLLVDSGALLSPYVKGRGHMVHHTVFLKEGDESTA